MRRLARALAIAALVLCAVMLGIRLRFGGGRRLDDRTSDPLLPPSALEIVADLDYPPGNVAVSRTGRVFFTLHPEGSPPVQVVELVGGRQVPYPTAAAPPLQSVLALRIDRQDRLWLLDYARGTGQPRILGFDLGSGTLVHHYDFPSAAAGLLSMLSDFQIDPTGEKIYIAESSPIRQTAALVVYDTVTRTSRRLFDGHPSVLARDYVLQAPGRDIIFLSVFALRIGVDSIALDPRGEWLYYGPASGDRLYRIATGDMNDAALTPRALGDRVQDVGPKTLSQGLSTDTGGTVYITDPEHSAIVASGPDRTLTTILKDTRLRWPDGLGFGPDGWLYVTCSALHEVLFTGAAHVRAHAPYQIFRFKPGPVGVPGH